MSSKPTKRTLSNDAAHRLAAVASYARPGWPQRTLFAGKVIELRCPMTVNRAHRELRKIGVDGLAHPHSWAGGAR